MKQLWNKLKPKDKNTLLFLLGLLGIALIFLSEYTTTTPVENREEEAYAKEMAIQICQIIEKMDSVGKASVLITLEKSAENEYVYQEKVSTDEKKTSSQKEYVLVGSGADKRPLISYVNEPVIKGVLVVCDGADDPKVYNEVLTSVTTLLGISSAKVHITKSR